MSLLASIILSAFFLNSSHGPDSLKTGVQSDVLFYKEINKIADDAFKGAKTEYLTDINNLQSIKVTFQSAVLFDFGKSTLSAAAKDALSKIAEIIIKNPAIGIAVTGHTDNIGTLEVNQQLSEIRAKVVADYLLSKNVPPGQLREIGGKNFSEPVADNSTEVGRSANRNAAISINLPLLKNDSAAIKRLQSKTKPMPPSFKKLLESVIKKTQKSNAGELEIDGLLVDDTKTKTGKDFYDIFYSRWEPPKEAKNYTITISEKPFRLSLTIIIVFINENSVYQAFLQPRLDVIEAISEEAIQNAQNYLAYYEDIMKQLNGEDMSGTGIF